MINIAYRSLSKTVEKLTFLKMQTVAHYELCTTICAGTSIPLIPRAERFKELQAKPSASADYWHRA